MQDLHQKSPGPAKGMRSRRPHRFSRRDLRRQYYSVCLFLRALAAGAQGDIHIAGLQDRFGPALLPYSYPQRDRTPDYSRQSKHSRLGAHLLKRDEIVALERVPRNHQLQREEIAIAKGKYKARKRTLNASRCRRALEDAPVAIPCVPRRRGRLVGGGFLR